MHGSFYRFVNVTAACVTQKEEESINFPFSYIYKHTPGGKKIHFNNLHFIFPYTFFFLYFKRREKRIPSVFSSFIWKKGIFISRPSDLLNVYTRQIL